ncbi:MAG: cyclic nucleotide-binding domain-containing protein [Spirochaetes bacterium]|nr:cyclic nucleotide-binding domain-containing protein [Spirochaetota bacterium]
MAYKLKKGVFRVKCNAPNCSFDAEFEIGQNVMGVSQEDVIKEAKKVAKDMAIIMHDAQYGIKHSLTNPIINKITGIYEAIDTRKSLLIYQKEAIKYKEYKKGQAILKTGDIATTICEVVRGSAYPYRNKSHIYNIGDSFGAASLLINQSRTADIISGEDGTTIAFYNLRELSKKDPRKAKELYNKAMEDIFDVILEMEELISQLEKNFEKAEMKNNNKRERIFNIEKELIESNKMIRELKVFLKK